MGTGRLMDGVMLIILVMTISWTLMCGRRAQNVADQETEYFPAPWRSACRTGGISHGPKMRLICRERNGVKPSSRATTL
jgi:hypothetical protein